MSSNSKSDNSDWRFHRSYTQTIDTGPSADHTTGPGLYFCIPSIRRISARKHQQIKRKRPLASTDDTLFDLLYREKTSLRHVAMVAKNLDANKAKSHLKVHSHYFKLHRSYSVSFNLLNLCEILFRTVSENFCMCSRTP